MSVGIFTSITVRLIRTKNLPKIVFLFKLAENETLSFSLSSLSFFIFSETESHSVA